MIPQEILDELKGYKAPHKVYNRIFGQVFKKEIEENEKTLLRQKNPQM